MLGTSRSFSLGTWYFLKIAKNNSQKKNQSVLIAKISYRKTQKIANPAKLNSRKISVPHGIIITNTLERHARD